MMMNAFRRLRVLLLLVSLLLVFGCEAEASKTSGPEGTTETATAPDEQDVRGSWPPDKALKDEELAAYRSELIEMAYSTASSYPLVPHIKNRSRAQERVVKACLALDQPARALAYSEGIANWRRGLGYALVAVHAAEQGAPRKAEELLVKARLIGSAKGLVEDRGNQIKEAAVKAYALLGLDKEADEVQATLVGISPLRDRAMKVMRNRDLTVAEKLDALAEVAGTRDFDMLLYCLEAYTEILADTQADKQLEAKLEAQMWDAFKTVPLWVRIDSLERLGDVTLRRGDGRQTLVHVEKAREILESAKWSPGDEIRLSAKLAALQYRAGDEEAAKKHMDVALAMYDEKLEANEIISWRRGEALRTLAEAYNTAGDKTTALAVYKRAMAEIERNPNIRPRTDNLTALCVSMALSEVEPDADLWARIRQIHGGLTKK